jgi:hypothetical protein
VKAQTTHRQKNRTAVLIGLCLSLVAQISIAAAANNLPAGDGPALTPGALSFLGIYESVPPGEKVPGAIAASPGALDSLPLTAEAQQQAAARPTIDPKDMCQVLGPFRMMARPDVKFEILNDAPNKFVMLFERSSWGHVRTIGIDARHLDFTNVRPMWNGDSIATWEHGILVIDTVHFTSKTWLNEFGVLNSKQLHLTERLRLLDGGKYLEYQATATDPDVLVKPVAYTRYFKRTTSEITEYNCFDHKPTHASGSHQ